MALILANGQMRRNGNMSANLSNLQGDPRSANGFLAALSADDFEFIRPHLRTIELRQSDVLTLAGQPFERVYMPHSGIISVVVRLTDGERIEIAMIGHDSLLGAFSTLGDPVSLAEASVLLGGVASVLDVERFAAAASRSAGLRAILVRHGQALFAQAQQSVACNACHAVESRLARYLMRVRGLSGNDNFVLTQEILAEMIGARRNSVSHTANALQKAGLIRYSRGRIEISDVRALEESSCECYGTVKRQYERLLGNLDADTQENKDAGVG
jgi:CRP-like cAMP-binding protein